MVTLKCHLFNPFSLYFPRISLHYFVCMPDLLAVEKNQKYETWQSAMPWTVNTSSLLFHDPRLAKNLSCYLVFLSSPACRPTCTRAHTSRRLALECSEAQEERKRENNHPGEESRKEGITGKKINFKRVCGGERRKHLHSQVKKKRRWKSSSKSIILHLHQKLCQS